jgi:phosphoglycolate phosphatase
VNAEHARPSAVLFDLDGTLLDTAPDMVAVLQQLQAEQGLAPVSYDRARCHVSHGVNGLLRVAFGELPEAGQARLRERYLELYAARLEFRTVLFDGMAGVLAALEAADIPWGIVTNKPARLTEPLLDRLALRARCACVVSGDTIAERKPHPGPLLHALALIPAEASRAVYVGDAARDILAGRAAGMRTVVALYGYIPPEETPASWRADYRVSRPADLLGILTSHMRAAAAP